MKAGSKETALIYWAVGLLMLGLIAAITLAPPERRSGRDPARRAQCLSNLRQIGLAIGMYADEFQGRCPVGGNPPNSLDSFRLLSNIVRRVELLHCPQDPRGAPAHSYSELTTKNVSYSYVPGIVWQDVPDSVLALDRIHSTTKGSHWPVDGNHNGKGGNVLFNDGHVEWKVELPCDLKDKDGKLSLISP